MLEKTFDPATVEATHYESWEAAGAFRCQPDSHAAPYCIVIPPPNVTGSLHMGHALNNTLQDILIRMARLQGKDALWQPGTDHAGIATQMVVERQLEAKGESRRGLGRGEFLKRVWDWKAESGGTIIHQLRRLGASADWSRERFTMDEGLSRAVRKVFVELYRQKLIYRDKRLVNWDPKLLTAISDLEVEPREIKGSLWYIDYPIAGPIAGQTDSVITVATTRPETMLGDTAIAVHPEDPKWGHLIGSFAVLPLVGRRVPIIADTYSDPDKGTGAVKITPAHDFNDFEVGKRHALAQISVLDRHGCLDLAANQAFLDGADADDLAWTLTLHGLDRAEARKKIVARLEEIGRLRKIEPHTHMVPHGDRSGVVIEPYLTDQWYVDAPTLAKPAIAAVEQGRTVFMPKAWENTYFEWMRNIQPWCVSRQLWWGHQIPVWYGPDGHPFCALDAAEAADLARDHYGASVDLIQDEDVLDTWFSSALWPFSTLGWPDKTPELDKYYPTEVLVTGFDIIFFWVARMMMMGLHFMGEVPFRTVYVHALVRDEKGQKMSKSKGNVLDPLELIATYGTDALRFTLAALAAPGRDVRLATSRIEGYRNFATKLWNAARYAEMKGCALAGDYDPTRLEMSYNRWIIGKLAQTSDKVAAAIAAYRFDEAANALYQFIWGTFCDWYIELTKPILDLADDSADRAAQVRETKETIACVLQTTLQILHPVMPFITEELNQKLFHSPDLLIQGRWPSLPAADPAAAAEIDWLVRVISEIRTVRAEMNVPAGSQIELVVRDLEPARAGWLATHDAAIRRLARVGSILRDGAAPQEAAQIVIDAATLVIPLAGVIDLAAERTRLDKDLVKQRKEADKLAAKLANDGFRAKADPAVIEEVEERLADLNQLIARLVAARGRLG